MQIFRRYGWRIRRVGNNAAGKNFMSYKPFSPRPKNYVFFNRQYNAAAEVAFISRADVMNI